VDGFFGQKYLPRYNYSPTPIPGILQACAESRQVALDWYQLTLAPAHKEPRTYFDLSADYLYIACENCKAQCCNDCSGIISYECQHEVQKVLFPWPGQYIDPFHSLFMSYRRIKEVLMFDPDTLSVKPEMQLVHLKETTKPFNWQNGKDLHAMFLEMKGRLNSRREQWPQDEWCFRHFRLVNEHIFHIEKITRVELAVTPETSKMYGFMEEKFKDGNMDFGLR
jgi:hypothetical protein